MNERPLFDDESLPLWLRVGGITFAGRKRATSEVAAVVADAGYTNVYLTADLPPWMKKADTTPALHTPEWMTLEEIEPITIIAPFPAGGAHGGNSIARSQGARVGGLEAEQPSLRGSA